VNILYLLQEANMDEMVYVDKMGKEYQVLGSSTLAYLYEDGYEIFRGSLKAIEDLGLRFERKGTINTGGTEL
jgi:hypothetical protein